MDTCLLAIMLHNRDLTTEQQYFDNLKLSGVIAVLSIFAYQLDKRRPGPSITTAGGHCCKFS